jgi:hypothetical protein
MSPLTLSTRLKRFKRFKSFIQLSMLCALLSLNALAWAQAPEPQAQPTASNCPSGNLLKDLTPIKPTSGVERSLRLTDGHSLKEGTTWDVVEAMIIKTGGRVTYDLGVERALVAFTVQGDNNDVYELYGSRDGKSFTSLWKAREVKNKPGLRLRAEKLKSPTAPVRYLQLRASGGDKSYSASELQAFCQLPQTWPPKAEIVSATRQKSSKDTRKHFIGRAKIGLGLFGLLIFFVPRLVRGRRERDEDEDQEAQQEAEQEITHEANINLTQALVYLSALAATSYSVALGIFQMQDAFQDWADNGLLRSINTLFPVDLSNGLDAQEISFVNGLSVALFGLASLAYVLKQIKEQRSARSLVAPLETLGFIGVVWVVMTQGNELLGKSASWWPKGWEGLVVVALMSAFFIALHRRSSSVARRRVGWLTTLVLGLMTWVSLGSFHGNRITHFWDSYHYYVGSKYFAENRYHLLYHCTMLAERDDGRESKIKGRALRNLMNNEVGKGDEVLDDQNELVKECRAHFTPQRWEAFKQDTRLFRSYMGESWWAKMFKDHGYNATPVWTLMGSLITGYDWEAKVPPPELAYTPQKRNGRTHAQLKEARERFFKQDRPAFEREIIALNFIDLTLYCVMFLMFLWAFGLEVTAFVALFFGTGYAWSYDWTGGSVGRIPWLFTAVAGLSFLKRGFPLLGGFSLGWSLLLRVFPGAVLGGAALQLALMLFKRDSFTTTYKRFTVGGLLSLGLLVPLSLITGQGVTSKYEGVSVYQEFISNSMKHKDTPLTNNMGYPTVLSFHPGYTVAQANYKQRAMQRKTKEKKPNFWLWKTKHRELKKSRAPLQWLTILGMFAFLYVMRKRWSLWEMTSASVVFIFLIFELTCYYYSFLILLAPLAYQRARDIFGLLTIGVASQIIQIRIGATDLEYFWESLFVLIPMLVFVAGRVHEHLNDQDQPQAVLGEVDQEDGQIFEPSSSSKSTEEADFKSTEEVTSKDDSGSHESHELQEPQEPQATP